MTVRIGLTGPIGCGKSTVSGWLGEQAGVVVIDADREARLVLGPGTAEVDAVYERFGAGLRGGDGRLDREALGRIVFDDGEALRDLEAIVHPAVRARILTAMADAEGRAARAVLIEAIKLVEGGLAELCDEVWLVTCDPPTQRQRLLARGASGDEIEARIAAQAGIEGRVRPGATRILSTDGSPDEVRRQAEDELAAALDA